MPRPRFQNLAKDKRHALLEAAAKEFAEHGYEQASLNRILEAGGMSKGAAYYYFDDKADVFVTAIRYYLDGLFAEINTELLELSAEDFWPNFKKLYMEHLLMSTAEESWRYGVARALFTLSPDILAHPAIQETFSGIHQWVEALIEKGQTTGYIRDDLPKSFLLSIAIGIDSTIDTWFADNAKNLPAEERELVARRAAELMQNALQAQ